LRELGEIEILEVLRQGKGRRPTTYIFNKLIEITLKDAL